MYAFYIAALSLGILGNMHCAGMCGPLAMALPVHNFSKPVRIFKILTYNFGRILTYSILGFLFGLLGKGFVISGYQQFLSIFSGIFILLFLLVPRFSMRIQSIRFVSKVKQGMQHFLRNRNTGALFILGLLNGLLPCGLVYVAIAAAIASGQPMQASKFMMLFGLATLPTMFSFSYLVPMLNKKRQSFFRKLSPAFVIVIALVLVLRGMNLGIPYLSPKINHPFAAKTCGCHKQD